MKFKIAVIIFLLPFAVFANGGESYGLTEVWKTGQIFVEKEHPSVSIEKELIYVDAGDSAEYTVYYEFYNDSSEDVEVQCAFPYAVNLPAEIVSEENGEDSDTSEVIENKEKDVKFFKIYYATNALSEKLFLALINSYNPDFKMMKEEYYDDIAGNQQCYFPVDKKVRAKFNWDEFKKISSFRPFGWMESKDFADFSVIADNKNIEISDVLLEAKIEHASGKSFKPYNLKLTLNFFYKLKFKAKSYTNVKVQYNQFAIKSIDEDVCGGIRHYESSYIIGTGRNWKGPIKKFGVVVKNSKQFREFSFPESFKHLSDKRDDCEVYYAENYQPQKDDNFFLYYNYSSSYSPYEGCDMGGRMYRRQMFDNFRSKYLGFGLVNAGVSCNPAALVKNNKSSNFWWGNVVTSQQKSESDFFYISDELIVNSDYGPDKAFDLYPKTTGWVPENIDDFLIVDLKVPIYAINVESYVKRKNNLNKVDNKLLSFNIYDKKLRYLRFEMKDFSTNEIVSLFYSNHTSYLSISRNIKLKPGKYGFRFRNSSNELEDKSISNLEFIDARLGCDELIAEFSEELEDLVIYSPDCKEPFKKTMIAVSEKRVKDKNEVKNEDTDSVEKPVLSPVLLGISYPEKADAVLEIKDGKVVQNQFKYNNGGKFSVKAYGVKADDIGRDFIFKLFHTDENNKWKNTMFVDEQSLSAENIEKELGILIKAVFDCMQSRNGIHNKCSEPEGGIVPGYSVQGDDFIKVSASVRSNYELMSIIDQYLKTEGNPPVPAELTSFSNSCLLKGILINKNNEPAIWFEQYRKQYLFFRNNIMGPFDNLTDINFAQNSGDVFYTAEIGAGANLIKYFFRNCEAIASIQSSKAVQGYPGRSYVLKQNLSGNEYYFSLAGIDLVYSDKTLMFVKHQEAVDISSYRNKYYISGKSLALPLYSIEEGSLKPEKVVEIPHKAKTIYDFSKESLLEEKFAFFSYNSSIVKIVYQIKEDRLVCDEMNCDEFPIEKYELNIRKNGSQVNLNAGSANLGYFSTVTVYMYPSTSDLYVVAESGNSSELFKVTRKGKCSRIKAEIPAGTQENSFDDLQVDKSFIPLSCDNGSFMFGLIKKFNFIKDCVAFDECFLIDSTGIVERSPVNGVVRCSGDSSLYYYSLEGGAAVVIGGEVFQVGL